MCDEAVGEGQWGADGEDAATLECDPGRSADGVPEDAAVIERECRCRAAEDGAVPDAATLCEACQAVRYSSVVSRQDVGEGEVGVVDDPGAFTRPWSGSQRFNLERSPLEESVCAENNVDFFNYNVVPMPQAGKPDF